MARSIVNQGFLIQRETTPGTAATDAMQRYLGIKGTVGWDVTEETFRAAGYKANTGKNILTEMGTADLEVIQDYNAMLPLLTGVFGQPVTTELDTGAYEHVFTINPKAADDLVTYTAMWGDASHALQATALAFHGLTIGVQRTSLSLSANAILRAPQTGVSLPTTGVTEVPFVPVRAQTYDVYLDNTYANIGTSKLLALYNTEVNFGDKYAPDWVVNSALESYSELMEQENIDYTQNLTVGFDSTAEGMIDAALDGNLKFVRVASTGPTINGTDNYSLQVDTCVSLRPASVGSSPISPATVVNFEGNLMVDGESGFLAAVTLVNSIEGK